MTRRREASIGRNMAVRTTPQTLSLGNINMVNVALLVRLEDKPGEEAEVEAFLKSALPRANQEPDTTAWLAIKFGPTTFGVFDAFPGDAGRQAHLDGPIAAALIAKSAELLSKPPLIEMVDVSAAKLSG